MMSMRLAALGLPLALLAAQPVAPPQPQLPAVAEPAPPAPTPPSIALPTLARTLEGNLARVRYLETVIAPSAAFARAERSLPELNERLAKLEASLLAASPDEVSFRELDLMRVDWLELDGTLSDLESSLEKDAKAVDEARSELDAMEAGWTAAMASDWREQLPPALTEKIDALLLKIADIRAALAGRIAGLLTVQDEVSSGRARVQDALDRSVKLSAQIGERLFAVENDPLWSALAHEHPSLPLGAQTIASWHASVTAVLRALQRERARFAFQIALFAVLATLGWFLTRHVRANPDMDDVAKEAARFLGRPYSAAGVLALFSTFWIYPPSAVPLYGAALTLLLIPYLRFVPKLAQPTLRASAYGFGALFLLDRLHDFALPHSLLQRLILLATGLLGIAGWLLAHRAGARASAVGAPGWGVGTRTVARVAIVFLAIAVIANVIGNVSLAEQLTIVAVKGAFAGAILMIVARILESLYVLLLRYLMARGARLVVRNAALLERRGCRTIRTAAVATWIVFLLWVMRIIEQSGEMVMAGLKKQWALGHVHVGLGALVAFAAALTLGIVVARLIRFILDEAVFPRMTLPRGVPAAISTTVGYLVVTAGFVTAFLAAGLEMSQFTFLVGAFGVGIGFGLQNIVNNFVSGLILLYERPIQVGDVLTVGAKEGRVRRIGIRSSTLATFDGAEVIVPNATLIATDVVNWTLSDRYRRVQIAIGASYGSDPRVVLEILTKVARAHAEVLASPEPTALFTGFGESSLNFELRFWTPEYDAYLLVASEVRTAIVAAFAERGIEIPFPQRDLHIRSVDASAGQALTGNRDAE
jgi:small-conductance mechanosensitive channel